MLTANKTHTLAQSLLLGLAMAVTAIAGEIAPGPDTGRQQELRQMLARDCGVCHGKSLQGDLGPPLTAETLAGKSEDYLIKTILEGHEETAMPPWWWTLQEHEAHWLVRYISSGRVAGK